MKYYPHGEEQGAGTANDRDKYGTYYRDQTTGLDYAQNRYYASSMGRFLTPDPYVASAGPADPGSWNRYAYVGSDLSTAEIRVGMITATLMTLTALVQFREVANLGGLACVNEDLSRL
jgi:RHS repeat-associated protein